MSLTSPLGTCILRPASRRFAWMRRTIRCSGPLFSILPMSTTKVFGSEYLDHMRTTSRPVRHLLTSSPSLHVASNGFYLQPSPPQQRSGVTTSASQPFPSFHATS